MRRKHGYERIVLVAVILLITMLYFLHSSDLRTDIRTVQVSEIVKENLQQNDADIIASRPTTLESPSKNENDLRKPKETPPKGQEQLIQKMHVEMEENLKIVPPLGDDSHMRINATVKPLLLPTLEQTDWQEVTGTEYHFSIYSAYHISGRSPPEVLVIGTARTLTNETIFCRIYYNEDAYSQTNDDLNTVPLSYTLVPGTIETMDEHWNMTYAGVFIHCPYSGNKRPEIVSILLPNQTELIKPSNMVRVQNKKDLRMGGAYQFKFKFSVCVLPIFGYNETMRLVEWIEFYKMMGVEKITLYNVSMGPDASCILHDLMEGNDPLIKMNVIPWHKNPIKDNNLTRSGYCAECALSAASNDCLYRHRGISKYVALLDLDEFIMPREKFAKNYSQLFDYLEASNPNQSIGHYSFRSGFFDRSRPNDPTLLERCSGFQGHRLKACRGSLLTTKVWREEELHSYNESTTYIIKPEGVNQTSTHRANILEPGYSTLNVSGDVALSRSYQLFNPKPGPDMVRVSQEFGNELVNNIANKMEYFGRKCKLKDWAADTHTVERSEILSEDLQQNDGKIITFIWENSLLEPPSTVKYNLKKPDENPSKGQAQFIQKMYGDMKGGFFVECGALDGETRSNSLWLETHFGWKGLLVEGDPKNYALIQGKHRKAWTSNTCLATKPHPHEAQFMQSFNVGKIVASKGGRKNVVTVQCMPLFSLLSALNVTTVDYFSLDVEGSELQVLKTIPFDKILIKALSVEYIHTTEGKDSLMGFMEAKGYEMIGKVNYPGGLANDFMFAHNSILNSITIPKV